MVDILVRNVDESTAAALKAKAKAAGKSVGETAREALAQYVRPSREEAWAAADAIRKKIGRVSGDSTADIREDRDSR
jgi:plasmid stability protein